MCIDVIELPEELFALLFASLNTLSFWNHISRNVWVRVFHPCSSYTVFTVCIWKYLELPVLINLKICQRRSFFSALYCSLGDVHGAVVSEVASSEEVTSYWYKICLTFFPWWRTVFLIKVLLPSSWKRKYL